MRLQVQTQAEPGKVSDKKKRKKVVKSFVWKTNNNNQQLCVSQQWRLTLNQRFCSNSSDSKALEQTQTVRSTAKTYQTMWLTNPLWQGIKHSPTTPQCGTVHTGAKIMYQISRCVYVATTQPTESDCTRRRVTRITAKPWADDNEKCHWSFPPLSSKVNCNFPLLPKC